MAGRLRQGFSGLDLALHEYKTFKDLALSVLVSTALPISRCSLPTNLLVVEPDVAPDSLRSLSSKIVANSVASGISASFTTLGDILEADLSNTSCVVLIEACNPLLYEIDDKSFDSVKSMILSSASTLWITSGGIIESQRPEASLITGLGRTVRAENPALALSTLDLDPSTAIDTGAISESILRLVASTWRQEDRISDWKYALRGGMILTNRMIPQKEMNKVLDTLNVQSIPELLPFKQPNRPLQLEIGVPGLLNTLQFVDDTESTKPMAHDDVEIEVKASGLNFVDIMVAMGQISDSMLGAECSGVVTRMGEGVSKFKAGDRVMTWLLGCHQTLVRNPQAMFQSIPDDMTFEVAASMPTIYCTVYYSLFDAARLRKGETVLIHAAVGGVGQAAIILSQYLQAEIFVTVSSEEKKALLMEKYNIPEDHIFNSRNLSFAKSVMRMTANKGVDVVLNSLAGEALRQTWRCIAMFGRFVEIGKKDVVGNTGLDMAPFMNNVTFTSVNLLGIYRHNVPLASRIFQDVVDLIHKGVIRAVEPLTVYDYSQIESAFRTMQTGKHLGKIVLRPNAHDLVPVSSPLSQKFDMSNCA